MVDTKEHDILKTKEEVREIPFNDHHRFTPGSSVPGYEAGSIFLSLRRRKVVKFEFAGRTMSKVFEEIVLAPDGIVGVLEKTRCSHIRSNDQ